MDTYSHTCIPTRSFSLIIIIAIQFFPLFRLGPTLNLLGANNVPRTTLSSED